MCYRDVSMVPRLAGCVPVRFLELVSTVFTIFVLHPVVVLVNMYYKLRSESEEALSCAYPESDFKLRVSSIH